MASNPMQRKSRNSFLLGIIVTLIFTGAVIALLLVQLKDKNEELLMQQQSKRSVFTLTETVKANQIITRDMIAEKSIDMNSIPANATELTALDIDAWFLQTKEGESIFTDKYGWYIDRTLANKPSDSIVEVVKNNGDTFKDNKDQDVANGDYYVEIEGIIEKIASTSVQTDDYGYFYVASTNHDKITRVYQELDTEEFYVFKLDTSTMNTTGTRKRVKEYIDIKNVPVVARIDMYENTVITPELVVQSDRIVTDDTRVEEYNMITLPIDLMTNDYVDIRLKTPSGQNFIVVAKVQVDVPMNADGTYLADKIRVNLREDEILAMSSAIVEAYGLKGAELYVTKYVDPAMQKAAYPTYTPNAAVTAQIDANGDGIIDNPNLVENAKQLLAARYSEAAKKARNDYLQQVINGEADYIGNIEEGTEESLTNSITARQKYLESLVSITTP